MTGPGRHVYWYKGHMNALAINNTFCLEYMFFHNMESMPGTIVGQRTCE